MSGGWLHPITCINVHDDGGNCLDDGGMIVGWPDELSEGRLARALAVADHGEAWPLLLHDVKELYREHAAAILAALRNEGETS